MSLLDKASLIVTPNAYKESVLYSVVPNTTLGDMNVVRATTATRVNSAGLIEVVPRNLVAYSEQFNNASWFKSQSSITANSINSPNGNLTADTFIANGTSNTHSIVTNSISFISGTTYAMSIYAKKNTNNFIQFVAPFGVGGMFANFDLNNGVVGTVGTSSGSNPTSSIENYGNDWYKCNMIFTSTTTTSSSSSVCLVASASAIRAESNSLSTSVYLWGAQVEQGSTATTYFPTTTRLNIPRIDYTNGTCPSLLVEPQRTNITLQSEDLSTIWYTAGGLLTANATTSPSGTLTADKIIADNTNGIHVYQQTLTVSNATVYTMSVFVKSAEYTSFELADASSLKGQTFNLTAKTISAPQTGGFSAALSSNINDLGNGWLRCSITYNTTSTTAFFRISLSNGATTSFTGNNISGLFAWGAQLEVGSYASSYIPTVASTITRNADVISKTGISSLIGQTEGTIFIDFNVNNLESQTSNPVIFSTSGTNYIRLFTSRVISYFESNTVSISSASNVIINGRNKIAVNYKNNDFSLYVNGVLVGSNNSGSVVAKSNFSLNYIPTSVFDPSLFYNSIQFYKTKLTNAESIALTTL